MRSPLLARLHALAPSAGIAIEDDSGRCSFTELYERALCVRDVLCAGASSLEGRRVALLVSPGRAWVESFLGVLLSGGVAVPLSPLYPPGELAFFVEDADCGTLIVSPELSSRVEAFAKGRRVVSPEALPHAAPRTTAVHEAIARIAPTSIALFLYTSGTTGKPKGAMLSHQNLAVQAELLREAWGFTRDDVLLHALPLHHLHGMGISLLTSLLAGAATRMLPRFDAARVWDELEGRKCTVFMAVPTMYQKLFEAFDAADDARRVRFTEGARSLRLATSGSAKLPVTLAARWEKLTGTIPLERFGMTEIGVGMTNPLEPRRRRAGTVGLPLPTVEHRIVADDGRDIDEGPGELYIRGPSVITGYFNRDEASRAAFADGWFKTGDIAERSPDGYIRLLGRSSVDILKSGGYKLSALEIEEALRENPAVAEVAVVGLPDEVWGDRVVAVVVPAKGHESACAEEALRAWAKERMATYKVPRQIIRAEALPKNPLGKVVKPDLVRALERGELENS